MYRGTAASSENAGAARSGEGVDEADEATQALASIETEDLEPLHMFWGQSRGEEGGASWINPRKHPKGRQKVNPKMEDNAKSIPHTSVLMHTLQPIDIATNTITSNVHKEPPQILVP